MAVSIDACPSTRFSGEKNSSPNSSFLNEYLPQIQFAENVIASQRELLRIPFVWAELTSEAIHAKYSKNVFRALATSTSTKERALFYGTHVKPTKHKIVLTPGFFPPPEYILEAMEERVMQPLENFINAVPFLQSGLNFMRDSRKTYLDMVTKIIGYRSQDGLNDFKLWLERMGNQVIYGLESENRLTTENLNELVARAEEFKNEGGEKQELVFIGHSGGGVLNKLARFILTKKYGRDVVEKIVTIGSPEINARILDRFDELAKEDGLGGIVHAVAKRCMREDPLRGLANKESSGLQELLHNYAGKNKKDPYEVIYYSDYDIIVPKPESVAIEVGGPHITLPYQKRLLKHLSEHVLSSPKINSPLNEHILFDEKAA